MILPDVNVMVLAHRVDQDDHVPVREWLEGEVNSARPFALADAVVAGFVRVVTNARIFARPSSLAVAIEFADDLVKQPGCLPIAAGARHWAIFRSLLRESDARGNVVPDAHLAAIAIEHGATVATRDRGFARFCDLRWIDPLSDPDSRA